MTHSWPRRPPSRLLLLLLSSLALASLSSIAAAAAAAPYPPSTSTAFRPPPAKRHRRPRHVHSSSSFDNLIDLEARVAAVERLLDTHLYPTQAAAARKSLAFASQDRFLLGEDGGLETAPAPQPGLAKPHLTYGEFPLLSVARLLDQLNPPLGPDDVFVDLGSGAGRLVLGVSLLWPELGGCVGMELLPEVHALGVEALHRAQTDPDFVALNLPRSPCRFVQADAEAPTWVAPAALSQWGDVSDSQAVGMSMGMGATDDDPLAAATVVFAYSTTWRSEDALHLAEPLHAALLRRLGGGGGGKGRSGRRAGTVVFTTDKRFRDGVVVGGRGFRVVGQVDVPNPEVWESTAHVHELFEVDGDEEGERV